MKALTWQGKRDVRVEEVPDPEIEEPTDAIIRVTSTAICGSDLHLYEVLGAYLTPGDVLGHETDGHRRGGRLRGHATSSRATASSSRSTSPAGTAGCASAASTPSARPPRCATRARARRLFGYTSLYGSVPGGQAEYLRVPAGPVRARSRCPTGTRTSASSTSRTSCRPRGRACSSPTCRPGGTSPSSGSARSASSPPGSAEHLGAGRVIGVDLVPGAPGAGRRARHRDARPERGRRRRRRP